jgi:3-dehydroquinate synthase
MKHIRHILGGATTDFYLSGTFSQLSKICDKKNSIILTDENIYSQHEKRFKGYNTIVLKPGEEYKVQATVDAVIEQMIAMQADRSSTLIGVGGGVITDLAGYAASVYMRGIPFGFVPTSLLAMVDASIGGKNGIDVGVYKNLVGIIRQPSFILHDMAFLKTLPQAEWENGFAEIIKHACIRDAAMFRELESSSYQTYQRGSTKIAALVQRNALIKAKVVKADPYEKGERRLLNFGHTLGHALENQYELSHGQAVNIGMTYAAIISERLRGFKQAERVIRLIEQYQLPSFATFDPAKVFEVMKMDKKRVRKEMNYILLDKIGKGVIQSIPLKTVQQILQTFK